MEFEKVDKKFRELTPTKREGVRTQNPIVPLLISGETIFVPGGTDKELHGFYEVFRKRGYKLFKFKTVKDGVEGVIMYVEKKEEDNG